MADLTELYGPNSLSIKPKQNKYDNIIDSIIGSTNQPNNKYFNNTMTYDFSKDGPQPFGMNSYTNYVNPQSFTNEVGNGNEMILKQIEKQVTDRYKALKSSATAQPNDTTLPFADFRNEAQPKIMQTKKQLPSNNVVPKEPVVEKMTNTSNTDCSSAITHIMNCPECMKKLQAMFSKNSSSFESDMLDVVIYSLTGFFVLFILNSFINLGKFLVK